ncbi:hypothetical protein [Listeria phage LMTA-57]|uniref:Pentapeptide repeat-containing protein n=1 Tax=Listeria phage LMTA-57 TaxID=1486414 RepID=A0A068CBC1_9CAUD|nr:hypothetical protein QLX42_gp152 [Listeria phage LMTA-57]AID17650.1 hypothetical protein [Listeria phage LMTA-57]
MSYADLSNANLSNADLWNANLKNINLSYANLSHAELGGAILSHADLNNTNLSNAELSWVSCWQDVRGLTIVTVQVDTRRSNNQISYVKEFDIWTTGCFQGTLEELRTSIEKTHKHNEKIRNRYYRVIDFILNEVAE